MKIKSAKKIINLAYENYHFIFEKSDNLRKIKLGDDAEKVNAEMFVCFDLPDPRSLD